MEEKIVKVVKVELDVPLQALNEPIVGQRYLYGRNASRADLNEGYVLEVSTSGYWLKMFNGKIAEWINVEEFGVFEALGDTPLIVG